MTDEVKHERVSPSRLRASPFQYRRTYDASSLQQMADTARVDGILQELLVRPVAPANGYEDLEIVFGHRRWEVAKMIGLEDVPVQIRELTDAQARRMQIVENLQREDVHPIEEAEGFRAMMDDGTPADDIAHDTGRSRSYVYGRLKLLNAIPEVRQAALAGEIPTEVALYLARIHSPKLQEKALASLKSQHIEYADGGKRSVRRVREFLREKFMLELDDAIFDTTDAFLLPDTPACGDCLKRSGNAPEFTDVATETEAEREERERTWNRQKADPNLCTDGDCWGRKKKAHLQAEAAAMEAKGKTVIAGGKAQQIVGATGDIKAGYVPLKEVKDLLSAHKKAKGAAVETAMVQNQRDGKFIEVVKADDLVAASVKGYKAPKPESSSGNNSQRDWHAEQRAREEAAKTENLLRFELFKRVREAAATKPRDLEDLRLITEAMLGHENLQSDEARLIGNAWGVNSLDDLDLQQMNAEQLNTLLVDAVLVTRGEGLAAGYHFNAGPPKEFIAAAALYGVDAKAVYKELKAAAKQPASDEPQKKPKAKKATAEAA